MRTIPVMRRLALLPFAAVAAYFLITTLLVTTTMARDERPAADAIVVLGAAQYDGRPSPIYEARLRHALRLYQEGVAPVMVFTGGRGGSSDRFSEGEAGRRWALAQGVSDDAILVEEESRNTYENLRGVQQIMAGEGRNRVVLVSDPFHMFRALEQARDVGLEAYPSPTRSSPISSSPYKLVEAVAREDLAVGRYLLLGE